jgi:hypothetical protein
MNADEFSPILRNNFRFPEKNRRAKSDNGRIKKGKSEHKKITV